MKSPRGHVVEGLAHIDAGEWDRLVSPGSAALRHCLLSAWELSELPGLRSAPVVVDGTHEGGPLAACPGYHYDLDVAEVCKPGAGAFMAPLRKIFPRLLVARTYELGNPTPLTNPFLVESQASRADAVAALIEGALTEAEASSTQLMLVQNLTSLDGPAASVLRSHGFAGIPIPPTVVVHLPYETFDGYLAAMRSQYRRKARQVLDLSKDLTVEQLRDFGPLAEELAALWRLVYERAREMRREILTPAFFREASVVDETSVLLLRGADGSIASFALLLEEGRWLSFLQCGFDEEVGRSEGAYFRLLYEIVRAAIDGGHSHLELGMTTLPPKLDIGGVPVPLYAFVRHHRPMLQKILQVYGQRLAGRYEVTPRKVFKGSPPTAAELVAERESPAQ